MENLCSISRARKVRALPEMAFFQPVAGVAIRLVLLAPSVFVDVIVGQQATKAKSVLKARLSHTTPSHPKRLELRGQDLHLFSASSTRLRLGFQLEICETNDIVDYVFRFGFRRQFFNPNGFDGQNKIQNSPSIARRLK